MCDEAQLKAGWHFCVSSERNLVCTIEGGGTEVAVGLLVIERVDSIILVSAGRVRDRPRSSPAGILKSREGIRYLKVQPHDSRIRMLSVFGQSQLQSFVN